MFLFCRTRTKVLRRLENIVVAYRLRKPSALPSPYFLRARPHKQLSTVYASLTRHFDQKIRLSVKDSLVFILQDSNQGSPTARKYSLLFGGAYAPNDAIYRKRYAFTEIIMPYNFYFLRARRRKQLSTVYASLTRHFDQKRL